MYKLGNEINSKVKLKREESMGKMKISPSVGKGDFLNKNLT